MPRRHTAYVAVGHFVYRRINAILMRTRVAAKTKVGRETEPRRQTRAASSRRPPETRISRQSWKCALRDHWLHRENPIQSLTRAYVRPGNPRSSYRAYRRRWLIRGDSTTDGRPAE